ncbi:MAG: tRNA-dihydrouridine synthase [Pseudomonadales bacterium]|nr:tRNA-dihydrouridine synthase [Pseudomonadales bacterium]MCP5358596.1 tRNA-dihydrouridine synthase [Pseudomonadales bacterium]
MRIVLAPMEGLADVHLRRLITAQGGFDWVVSEFLRVVDRLYPRSVFYKLCPELLQQGRTESGVPVRVQLLGSDPEAMAANAVRAVELGSYGVDINFGCPSRTVNRRQGGAVMLKEPESLYRVVRAVREAVPGDVVVSAKMRLGYADTSLMLDNASAVESAGATELTVHARTRLQGYAPPAHWEALGEIRRHLRIPLIANGDICSVADYHRCVEIAGTPDVMLGRGAVRWPFLAQQIRVNHADASQWARIIPLLQHFWTEINARHLHKDRVGRMKQWINYLRQSHPEAEALWRLVREEKSVAGLDALLAENMR